MASGFLRSAQCISLNQRETPVARMIEIRKIPRVTGLTKDKPEWDVVVLRDGEPVAVLPHDSPLKRTLTMTVEELRAVIRTFPNIMKEQPSIRALIQALIEYKENRLPIAG